MGCSIGVTAVLVIPSHADGGDLTVEGPNPKTQIPGKFSKYPNSNGRQLLWGLQTLGFPWDLVLGIGISLARSPAVCAAGNDMFLNRAPRITPAFFKLLGMTATLWSAAVFRRFGGKCEGIPLSAMTPI